MTTELSKKIFETTFNKNTSFGEVISHEFNHELGCSKTNILVDKVEFIIFRHLNANSEYSLEIVNMKNFTVGRAKDCKTLEALVFKCLNNMVEE